MVDCNNDENVKELFREEVTLSVDVQRKVARQEKFSADVTREVANSNFIVVNENFDVSRRVANHADFAVDVAREVTNDSIIPVSLNLDVTRAVKKIGKKK